MVVLREKAAHLWQRDEHDWYVEPLECSLALFDSVDAPGPIWDPAVGLGRILEAASSLGKSTIGTDIVRRSNYCSKEVDFFKAADIDFRSIVCNPPFRIAEDFVRFAIKMTPSDGIVAMLLPLVWMAGFSIKRDWLPTSPLKSVLPMSPRPSMPPGAVIQAGERPGNGTKDFAWFVWQVGYEGRAELKFLNTSQFRRIGKSKKSNQVEFEI